MPVIRPDVWVHAPGGPLAAAVASFNVTADKKGSIALTWTASVDQAIVGGLELYHTGKGSPPKLPADISKSAVPPAAAPSYSPLDFSTSSLQAAAPGPLLSAGQLSLISEKRHCYPAHKTEIQLY